MLLRPGNAGADTVTDHLVVLEEAIAAIPAGFRAKVLIRIDGAGATHELLERIRALNTTRRTVRFCVGWKITPVDEDAIAALPATAWTFAADQDGEPQDDCHVAEITDLNVRTAGWPPGTRLIVRRSRPSRRRERKLTDFEKATGWRYQVTAIDYPRMRGVAGSHHPWFADVLYRQRGGAAEGRAPRTCTDATTKTGADRSSQNKEPCDTAQLNLPAESSRSGLYDRRDRRPAIYGR